MKKKIIITSVILMLAIFLTSPIAENVYASIFKTIEVITGINININGKNFVPTDEKGNKVEVFGYKGTTYVPIRAISDIYKTDINWDSNTKTVLLKTKELTSKPFEPKGIPQLILMPANPKKGFNFPYMLKIPVGHKYNGYQTINKYLIFKMTDNNKKSEEECIKDAESSLKYHFTASNFGYPIMIPIIPNTSFLVYEDTFGYGFLNEDILSRSAVYVKKLTTTDSNRKINIKNYNDIGVDYKKYYDLDKQVAAMIKDATSYLQNNNIPVEDKVIIKGEHHSGIFADRFTMLHPELVKMLISPNTLDNVMLPMDSYKGKKLNYPLGTADYKKITGKDFDLNANNKVAKLIYIDEDTDFSALIPYYSAYHRGLIPELFGKEILPRAKKMIELYKKSNGKALLILNTDVEYSESDAMRDYIIRFIKENADSPVPVYPEIFADNLKATFCNITPSKVKNNFKETEVLTYDGSNYISDDDVLLEGLTDENGNITTEDGVQIIIRPANPEKGFNFSYAIRLPNKEKATYSSENKYLFFNMINGLDGREQWCTVNAISRLEEKSRSTNIRADTLGFPSMMPIIARTGINVKEDKFGKSMLYEYALSRDAVYVKELTTTDSHVEYNILSYQESKINYEKYYDLDEQVAAMIKDAIKYLRDNNINVEDKVIMDGYSASGTFTDRFTMLHPDLVKILVTGATLDDLMLPVDSYQGTTLNFPLGIADYKKITGRDFDLEANNKVAKLIYMGEDDTNNTVLFNDCYSKYHMKLIPELFALKNLPRAKKMMEIYDKSDAKAMLILDPGIGHSSSKEMDDYVLEFIKANLDSDTPVYPEVKSKRLKVKLCE